MYVAQTQDIQMNELLHALDILESIMNNKDPILKSYDIVDCTGDDIIYRYI